MSDKERYRELSMRERSVALFQRGWWLDATCGENGWDVSLVAKGDSIRAALPYKVVRRGPFVQLGQPKLTPFLGPWLRDDPNGSESSDKRYSREKELMDGLIDGLPEYAVYAQAWSPRLTNWLPFFWRGFSQTTRYSYAIDELDSEALLWKRLASRTRRDVSAARDRFELSLDSTATLDELLSLVDLTYGRQGKRRGFEDELVRRIDEACEREGRRRILVVRDPEGRPCAGAYLVWDDEYVYYLFGGGDPELRNLRGGTLCVWEAILFAAASGHRFDFEGSMIEPIERFFRAFGARQRAYSAVSHERSKAYRVARAARATATALKG